MSSGFFFIRSRTAWEMGPVPLFQALDSSPPSIPHGVVVAHLFVSLDSQQEG